MIDRPTADLTDTEYERALAYWLAECQGHDQHALICVPSDRVAAWEPHAPLQNIFNAHKTTTVHNVLAWAARRVGAMMENVRQSERSRALAEDKARRVAKLLEDARMYTPYNSGMRLSIDDALRAPSMTVLG